MSGVDGYNSTFFKKTWRIVSPDIVQAVRDFFLRNGSILKQPNSTAITLVPKISNPISVNDFRPISCYNVIFKIISKMLAFRLRRVLNEIIHPN